ncbi:MAG: LamG domain-containing protein [Planctomycetota bacterium]
MHRSLAKSHSLIRITGLSLVLAAALPALAKSPVPSPYTDAVLQHDPAIYLPLNSPSSPAHTHGPVAFDQPGPRPNTPDESFPLFPENNHAATLNGAAYLTVPHQDKLNLAKGDSITLEAWVNLTKQSPHRKAYLFAKGSTHPTQPNLTYALYLSHQDDLAHLTFEFRAKDNPAKPHRYTAYSGFLPGAGWRHLAFTYTFGKPSSARAYLDGAHTPGAWAKGHNTNQPPVNNDQPVFIGASSTNTEFSIIPGLIDEPAVYHRALSAKQIASHYKIQTPPTDPTQLPADAVRVRILHGTPDAGVWDFKRPPHTLQYNQSNLAFAFIPNHYNRDAVIDDRTPTFLIRADTRLNLPPGEHTLMLRALNGARPTHRLHAVHHQEPQRPRRGR